MKIKQHVVITDPSKFLKGNLNCFNLFESDCSHMRGWIDCGQVEIEVNVNADLAMDIATHTINEKIGAASALLQTLENEKAELLSLPAPSEPHMSEYDAENEYNSDESLTEIGDRENAILDAQERG